MQNNSKISIIIFVVLVLTISMGIFWVKEKKYVNKIDSNTTIEDQNYQELDQNTIDANTAVLNNNSNTITKSNMCNKKDFTMAIILVTNNENISNISNYKVKLDFVKNKFPWAFNSATRGFATMSIPNDPVIFDSKGLEENGELNMNKVLKKFYESNPDDFDFVTVFSSYGPSSYHGTIKNNIQGIGVGTRDSTTAFGSKGRLLGVNYMLDSGKDRLYDVANGKTIQSCYIEQKNNFSKLTETSSCGLGLLLHEVEHQWAAYAGDIVNDDNPSTVDLGLRTNLGHFYLGLDSPSGTTDPFGTTHWKKSPDNSVYIHEDDQFGHSIIQYHPFVLYFMGLLPEDEYDTKFNIFQGQEIYNITLPDGGKTGVESMKSIQRQVSVQDIISKEGARECE